MWKAVKYRPDDLPDTVAMAGEHYGESWISDPGYLQWQYAANPSGPALIQLARDAETDRLAGQYAVIPLGFKADGQTVTGALSLNTLTRQAYKGQGIFTGLAQAVYQDCAAQGVQFCYGFPNPNSYPGFTKKLGFSDLGRIPLLLRPLNPQALVRKKIGTWLVPLALPFQFFFRLRKQPPAEDGDNSYEVYQLTSFDLSEFDAFWLKIQHKYPIMGIRDAAFIRWRYFENPYRDYQLYGIRRKGGFEYGAGSGSGPGSGLIGYIAGRCTEVAGMDSGMVVDFLVEPGHPAAGDILLQRLLRFFAANNMDLAGSLMLPHAEEYRLLKANGFFTCPRALEPQPFPVIYQSFAPRNDQEEAAFQPDKPNSNADDPFCQLNRWFLTMGDYDAV